MKSNSPIIRKYLKNIKNAFPIFGKYEKNYLSNLEDHLKEYIDENPSANYDDILLEFGTPSSIVSDYFSGIDDCYLMKKLTIKKHIRRAIAVIIILAMLLNGWCYYLAYLNYLKAQDEHIVYEETVIMEE